MRRTLAVQHNLESVALGARMPLPGFERKMTMDLFERRKKIKLLVGVLAVGIGMSVLVAVALIYLARMHPGS